jgi:prefoldin subunit 5
MTKEEEEFINELADITKQYVHDELAPVREQLTALMKAASAEELLSLRIKSLNSKIEKQGQTISSLSKHCESLEKKIGDLNRRIQ